MKKETKHQSMKRRWSISDCLFELVEKERKAQGL
jgi:hypothetical protein